MDICRLGSCINLVINKGEKMNIEKETEKKFMEIWENVAPAKNKLSYVLAQIDDSVTPNMKIKEAKK